MTKLISLQTLCARLRPLRDLFEHEGPWAEICCWPGVANWLLYAACASRVETDALAADFYDAGPHRACGNKRGRLGWMEAGAGNGWR